MSEKITLLLVDDHSIVRIGLKALINYQKDMSVVGEAKNGEEAIRLVRKLQPDVVIMDLMMPKLNGADATKQILCEYPNTKIIIGIQHKLPGNQSSGVTIGLGHIGHIIVCHIKICVFYFLKS